MAMHRAEVQDYAMAEQAEAMTRNGYETTGKGCFESRGGGKATTDWRWLRNDSKDGRGKSEA